MEGFIVFCSQNASIPKYVWTSATNCATSAIIMLWVIRELPLHNGIIIFYIPIKIKYYFSKSISV